MTCYHPIDAIQFGFHGEVKIFPSGYTPSNVDKFPFRQIKIPCGHCIGCRLDKSREWADRIMCELAYHDKACFITLTYDDKHLPDKRQFIDNDGVIHDSTHNPLVKKHLQDFIKRLRDRFGYKKVRYYAVGEYGEKNKRPHYHAIIFGVDFSDDRIVNFIRDGYIHYTSKTLYDESNPDHSVWKYGLCDIAEVSWNDAAYVARYTTKKQYGDANKVYEIYNYEPEFSIMSLKPGIGKQYLLDHIDEYRKYGTLIVPTNNGTRIIKSNHYFDSIAYPDKKDPLYIDVRINRSKHNKTFETLRYLKSELGYTAQLRVDEINKQESVKSLRREL